VLTEYYDTREKIIQTLKEGGKKVEDLKIVLLEGETEEDLRATLRDLRVEGVIYTFYGRWHLKTKDSEARRLASKDLNLLNKKYNPWVWYIWTHEDERDALRKKTGRELGYILKEWGNIGLAGPRTRQERIVGEMTQEEWEYITEVNMAIKEFFAALDKTIG
jgi:radical SAM superfamily enzyme YgiQ (UPF0313 family)